MKNKFVFFLLLFFVISSCKKEDTIQQTQTVNLQLDGYTTGATAAFQGGFVTGETAEVTLGPVTNTFQVTYVKFLFGGPGSTAVSRDIILKIYKDTGAGNPGSLLFSSTYTLVSSDITLQQLDLRDEHIMADGGGSIRVALEMTSSGYPSVATDQDGSISASKNWIKTGGSWVSGASLGLTGDFVIRATVEENI